MLAGIHMERTLTTKVIDAGLGPGWEERLLRELADECIDEANAEDSAKPRRKALPTEKRSDLLDIKDAADYLRVSVRTVTTLKKNKQLTYSRVRGQLRFRKIDLDRYLQKRTVVSR
jgi:excisionase family DNA binding protein